jgi:hypothetical protein
MPIFWFQFEVRPEFTHPKRDEYAGAAVVCWIRHDSLQQAEKDIRQWLFDEHWHVVATREAELMTREDQRPEGLKYYDEAEADGASFLFHIWRAGKPGDTLGE